MVVPLMSLASELSWMLIDTSPRLKGGGNGHKLAPKLYRVQFHSEPQFIPINKAANCRYSSSATRMI